MDGIPALDLGDLIVTVLHGHTHQNDKYGETRKNLQRERKFMEGDRELELVHRTRRDRVSVAFLVQGPCGSSDCFV